MQVGHNSVVSHVSLAKPCYAAMTETRPYDVLSSGAVLLRYVVLHCDLTDICISAAELATCNNRLTAAVFLEAGAVGSEALSQLPSCVLKAPDLQQLQLCMFKLTVVQLGLRLTF